MRAPRRVWDDYSPPDFDYIHDPSCSYDWTSEQFAIKSVEAFNSYLQGPGSGAGRWINSRVGRLWFGPTPTSTDASR